MSFCQEDFNCHIDFLRYVGMQDWLEVGKMAKKIIFCPGCGKAHLQNTTITKIHRYRHCQQCGRIFDVAVALENVGLKCFAALALQNSDTQ